MNIKINLIYTIHHIIKSYFLFCLLITCVYLSLDFLSDNQRTGFCFTIKKKNKTIHN